MYDVPIYFNESDYVYSWPTGELYVCVEPGTHTGKDPAANPSVWRLAARMNDDFRLDPSSPYQGIGLLE